MLPCPHSRSNTCTPPMGCLCSSPRVQDVGVALPGDVEQLQRNPELAVELSELLTRSFAGTADSPGEIGFDWCLGPDLAGKYDDLPGRHAAMGWALKYVVEDAFAAGPKGAVLSCRKPDGGIGGVAVLKVCNGKASDGICAMMTAGSRAGSMGKEAKAYNYGPRMQAVEAALKKLHAPHIASGHVYVWAVAVDPSAQGQGMGGRLMRAASAIADHKGLPCYLETCGAKLPAIYKKYGYEVVAEEVARTKAKGGKPEEVFEHPYIGMVRPKTG